MAGRALVNDVREPSSRRARRSSGGRLADGGYRGEMTSIPTWMLRGAVAGAVGTSALNATTYLDMAVRARPASTTPAQVAERGAEALGATLPEDPERRAARASGLGLFLGTVAGVSVGTVVGLLRGTGRSSGPTATTATAWALIMLAGNGPMTVLRVTDPRTWSAQDWLADVVPHLAYAGAAARTLEAFERSR